MRDITRPKTTICLSRLTSLEELRAARLRYAQAKGVPVEEVFYREKRGGFCFFTRSKKMK